MMNPRTLDEARAAKARAEKVFRRFGSVTGVGITRAGEGYGLKINLTEPAETSDELPVEVDGVPVSVEVVGVIRKRAERAHGGGRLGA